MGPSVELNSWLLSSERFSKTGPPQYNWRSGNNAQTAVQSGYDLRATKIIFELLGRIANGNNV